MRKARFAEGLLRWVTTAERAASTAGDLAESSSERGEFWFWSSLLRTVASRMWSGLASNPRTVFGLAIRAWLHSLLYWLFWFVVGPGLGYIFTAGRSNDFPELLKEIDLRHLIFCAICVQFVAGRWVAKRAPGSEFSAALALCIFQIASWLAFLVWNVGPISLGRLSLGAFSVTVATLPYILGAFSVSTRRKTQEV